MDRMTYYYEAGTNRLTHVNDTKADGLYLDDFDDQDTLNYTYDQSGNLVADLQASATITWTPYGKVASVDRDSLDQLITFGYGPDQNRFAKIKVNTTNLDATATYYIRDAQGNVMGVYKRVEDSIFWQEQYLYGSSRLGVLEPGIVWDTNQLHVDSAYFLINPTFSVGCKGYEVADHLGNIRAVVSDRREAVDSTSNSEADFYEGVVLAANDYYPFGQRMPGRTFQSGSYRYGFNGKEKDEEDEWGDLTHYDYGFRIYNPSIARFLSVDPLSPDYPWYTPYQFAGNKPMTAIDLDGLEELIIHSAFWTQKFLELDLATMTNEEILVEVDRINNKGYIDAGSLSYARQYYESEGQVITINPAPEGTLNITGFTNASSGDVIKFSLFSSVIGGFIKMHIPANKAPKGMAKQLEGTGVPYIMATFVMKYSGFGKLGRALINQMEGEDPWTGSKESTSELVIGGITDLVTMGTSTFSAGYNITANVFQEAAENLSPDQLEEIGLTREMVDLGFTAIFEKDITTKVIEIMANMIQAGYITDDLIEKHSNESE